MSKGKQRGSGWSIKLALWVHDTFGYNFIYFLLYPISFFYLLVASNAKQGLIPYYQHLNQPFTIKVYFQHLHTFAICMIDRFVSKMTPDKYTFAYKDQDVPHEILEEGAILLYSHFGGWAASQNGAHIKNKINVVMQEVMREGIKAIEDELKLTSQIHIIDLNQGTLAVSVQVANALMNNEIVAIMGDRAANEKSELSLPFLGEEAYFNKNPFQIAYKTKKTIVVYFIILTGKQKYTVEYITITMDQERKEALAIYDAMLEYVTKYEEIVKRYPQQWFNLFDFWEKK